MLLAKMKLGGLIALAVSILGIGAGMFIHQAVANDPPKPPALVLPDVDGPTIVVVDQPDAKGADKAKPAADPKAVRFQMQGVLEEVDAKENYITLRDMIRHATINLSKVKGQDGLNATFKLAKPTILKNLRVRADAKITDDGKEKKLSDFKPGLAVRVDLEYRQDGLVVVAIEKTKDGKNNLRIFGGLEGGIIIGDLQIDGIKKKDDKKP